jgi:hypothetical protein
VPILLQCTTAHPMNVLGWTNEATRFHNAGGRRGSRVADCGACAAGRTNATHRRAHGTVDDTHGQARLSALRQALQQLGWSDGRNVQIDIRWGEDDVDRERKAAVEGRAVTAR